MTLAGVRGTRLSVEFLLELAASGASEAEIPTQYPELTADGLPAFFRFTVRRMRNDQMTDLPISA
jgi:uncharacterized protein (DUF433 family)